MKGKDLYERWCEKMIDEGASVDTWDEISDSDKAAWDALANDLTPR